MSRYPFNHSHVVIDRDRLRSNARYLHRNLAPGVKSIAVIKADAYGHGAVEIARTLEAYYDMYAVANVTEAVILREAGIIHPILVFGVPVLKTAGAYREFDLIAVVSSEEHFDLLEAGTVYHVEIDSGMGRLGMPPDRLDQIEQLIGASGKIICQGVMSHFATADEQSSGHLARQKDILHDIRAVFGEKYPIHAANSAASLNHPETHCDMVRHGIAMYGYDPSPIPSDQLHPVMSWISWIAQCKRVKKGTPLSYGATWQAPADGHYAVVPIGYADGFRRNLSGKMPVSVEGHWYPQVGRVTMDYIMIWLGGDTYVPGTEVLVMGSDRNHAGKWAEAIGTIPYEICCGIHPKVPRVMSGQS